MKCIYYSFVCLIVAVLNEYASCDKGSRLKNIVKLIASRQDIESIARQKDTATILEILNELVLQLNEYHDSFQCSNSSQQEKVITSTGVSDTVLNNGTVVKETHAFKDEQNSVKTLKKQIPEVNKTVNVLDKMLDNFTDVVGAIRGEISTAADLQPVSTMAMIEEFLNPVLVEFKETLNKLSKSVQNVSVTVDEMTERSRRVTATCTTNMESCLSHYNEGRIEDGVYTVYPLKDNKPVKVYCDMTTDGGGWTIFQRRIDGSVDFLRGWQDYKQGFGNLTGEFWLGNDNIAGLTRKCCHELRIELEDFDGVRKYAKYGKFSVSPESKDYKLLFRQYSGNCGDSLGPHNRKKFSTIDRDNDFYSENCADMYKGAWWYDNCFYSNLNGLYFKEPKTVNFTGINWNTWMNIVSDTYSLKMTEMKLR